MPEVPLIKPDSYRINTKGIAAVVNAKCMGPSVDKELCTRFVSMDGGAWDLKLPMEFAGFCQKDDMVVFSITLIQNTLGANVV